MTLVLGQAVHVYVCKTRFTPMLEHGLFHNSLMNYGYAPSPAPTPHTGRSPALLTCLCML